MSTKRLFSLILAVAMLAAIVAGREAAHRRKKRLPPYSLNNQRRAKSLSRFPLLAKVR